MIHELLAEGRENARTSRELAEYLNCTVRDVTKQIERERRQGQPICAASGENPGYYLAADADELDRYCHRLHKRAAELYKTRGALISVLRQLQAQKGG